MIMFCEYCMSLTLLSFISHTFPDYVAGFPVSGILIAVVIVVVLIVVVLIRIIKCTNFSDYSAFLSLMQEIVIT